MMPAEYPPATYCAECRRLYNSIAPLASCCGVPTIPPPAHLAPSHAAQWAKLRRKEQQRDAQARRR